MKMYLGYFVDGACPYYRCLLPARFCRDKFKEYGHEILAGDGPPEGHDIYLFHGLSREALLIEAMKAKRKGAKFIWSVDDDWLTLPDWNQYQLNENGLALYEMAKHLSDYIVTSTPALRDTFSDVSHKVLMAPNLLDMEKFPEPSYEYDKQGNKHYNLKVETPVKILWAGSNTHKEDVEILIDPLDRLLTKHGKDKVVVIFQGMAPPPLLLTKYLHNRLVHQPSIPFASYQNTLNSIAPHIVLAPLTKIKFNQSKSNLRIMEGWGLCTAVVATDYGEYKCIESGKDGRLVDGPDSWFSALDRLVEDHPYRLQIAAQGHYRVTQQYNWQNPACRKPWYRVFGKLFGMDDNTIEEMV